MWQEIEGVLRAWREAERRLQTARPGTDEWHRAKADADGARERYRMLTERTPVGV